MTKEQMIIQLYPTHRPVEISAMLNTSIHFVCNTARKYGLKRNADTQERIHQDLVRMGKELTKNPTIIEKSRKTKIRKRRYHKMNVMSGIDDGCRWKVRTLPKGVYNMKLTLTKKYGYILSNRTDTLLYDSNTKRKLVKTVYNFMTEDDLTRKYGLRFEEAI